MPSGVYRRARFSVLEHQHTARGRGDRARAIIAACVFVVCVGCGPTADAFDPFGPHTETWSIVDRRAIAAGSAFWAVKRNQDGLVFGTIENLPLEPGVPQQFQNYRGAGAIEISTEEVTGWLDLSGLARPGCQPDCAPGPSDPVIVVRKAGPPWDIHFVFE